MKKPSLDAIRRFKEQQERKKLEETERKIQEKLSTLEHRAAQGDRKAKTELKVFERNKEQEKQDKQELDHTARNNRATKDGRKKETKPPIVSHNGPTKRVMTDFDELMRLAKNNTNEIRREEPKPVPTIKRIQRVQKKPEESISNPSQASTSKPVVRPQQLTHQHKNVQKQQAKESYSPPPTLRVPPPTSRLPPTSARLPPARLPAARLPPVRLPPTRLPPPSHSRVQYSRYDEDDEDFEDDDYEQDDFVVDEDDDDTQNEVSKTIRSVFGYDRRRCDLREAELDRQYRQIGRVSTFEDLEREERRASRLAALEDAQELRVEEERKKMKRMRRR